MENLQAGEQGAILLAQSLGPDLILLDEKSARIVAAAHGLRVSGTLGILVAAASRGLVQLGPAIDQLTRTNFRYSPALLKSVLDGFAKGF
jgi:predicted nucleic acid-binding protein